MLDHVSIWVKYIWVKAIDKGKMRRTLNKFFLLKALVRFCQQQL